MAGGQFGFSTEVIPTEDATPPEFSRAAEQLAEEHPTLEEFTYHHVIKVLINLAIMYDNDVILEEIGMDRKNRRRARRLSAIAT